MYILYPDTNALQSTEGWGEFKLFLISLEFGLKEKTSFALNNLTYPTCLLFLYSRLLGFICLPIAPLKLSENLF